MKVRVTIGLIGGTVAVLCSMFALLYSIVTDAVYVGGLRLNMSPSMPEGLWRERTIGAPLSRGTIVAVCPEDLPVFREAKRRGYLPEGECPSGTAPLLKPVVAIPGDTVTISPAGVAVNGVLLKGSAVFKEDSRHRPLRSPPQGSYRVRTGQVWLISTFNPRSFDSRYFGPVPLRWIRGTMTPVWVSRQ